MAARPNITVSTITPPALGVLTKLCQVARTDTTAFEAFSLPSGAVIAGAYVLGTTASDAQTTAVIAVGTNPGTTDDIITAFDVKGATGQGYAAVGAKGGTAMGTQITTDKLYKARYAETGTASTAGGPWLVKVEYYLPQSGNTY